MEKTPFKITDRIKQGICGRGYGNKFEKRHTNIPDPLFPEEPRVPAKIHKKRKKREPYRWGGAVCPFCDAELPIDEKELAKKENRWRVKIFEPRVKECTCGCYEVAQCPACKRATWYNPATKIYKHQHLQWSDCGFSGAKK